MTDLTPLIYLFEREGVLSTQDIASELGIHRATVTRQIKQLGNQVLRIGRGPQLRYCLRREIPQMGTHWPIYRVDESGSTSLVGTLSALRGNLWHVDLASEMPSLVYGEFKNGIFPGLPWFLNDMRPQGFLGRSFAKRVESEWHFPGNPDDWNHDQVLFSLIRAGSDLPGAFIIGDQGVRDFFERHRQAIDSSDVITEFPRLVSESIELGVAESSAGGDQQKFTISIQDKNDSLQRQLVKFSPKLESPVGIRWADLLRAEQAASLFLRQLDVIPASSSILSLENRLYLCVDRFDRTPDGGRRAVVSLRSFDAAYYGNGNMPWHEVATLLHRDGWLNDRDAESIRRVHWFGEFIGNTDMHYGNLSFFLEPDRPLSLTPIYDMLPMRFRPSPQGELPDTSIGPTIPTPIERESATPAIEAALDYWNSVESDSDFSMGFRSNAAKSVEILSGIKKFL